MDAGQSGKVITMHGGRGMTAKLEALGIRPGVVITKVSGQIMRGPVIIRVGNTQVAIGFFKAQGASNKEHKGARNRYLE
jgi:ferrous iron transport protein A